MCVGVSVGVNVSVFLGVAVGCGCGYGCFFGVSLSMERPCSLYNFIKICSNFFSKCNFKSVSWYPTTPLFSEVE